MLLPLHLPCLTIPLASAAAMLASQMDPMHAAVAGVLHSSMLHKEVHLELKSVQTSGSL